MPLTSAERSKRCYWNKTVEERQARSKARPARVYTEEQRKRQRDSNKAYEARKKGWGDELYGKVIYAQSLRCAICRRPFAVGDEQCKDHDHSTNAPRGILCRACNICLGYYEKWQRPAGLVLVPYEKYLDSPPASQVG